ncbi:Tm-1-like ATP-binding domain-containing protein [Membranihabitans maritimus]|uniref:Tm-1-like ATP-binding domain-containing protein n=1 Tax=Membranihabitans maritimus TaxID=2904244 RepID=UPI001F393D41|nr:Tm-1-like ATP-binding domain-containing protein [Membranihabitans maritimus]
MCELPKFIVILGCFDTKGADFAYLRSCIVNLGEEVLMINTGILGTTHLFPVDIEAHEVAEAEGVDLEGLRQKNDRGYAVGIMGKGAGRIMSFLNEKDQIKAVIGMGGGGGTYIALKSMQKVPFGIPKWCISTVASKDLSRQIGSKDIVLMPSIVDIAGPNSVSRFLMSQAAKAICSMAKVKIDSTGIHVKTIAITMFGNTTTCVDYCRELLEDKGYEVLVFHANGVGGKTMESLIMEGVVHGVLDITTTELVDELCGGVCSAGPDRLSAASEMGIPQVVAPGCMDMVNFAQPATVPPRYKDRQLYSWAPDVTLMRTNIVENKVLGKILAEKLNISRAPVRILLPQKGLSQIDSNEGVFYDPDANRVLFDSIQSNICEEIDTIEVNFHINDPKFSELAVATLLDLM